MILALKTDLLGVLFIFTVAVCESQRQIKKREVSLFIYYVLSTHPSLSVECSDIFLLLDELQ